MCNRSGILIWTIILIAFSTNVLGNNCDCEAEKLSFPDCGVIPTDPTIINGTSSSYPWMVFLYLLTDTDTTYGCGGSLISDLQVATAAHCVVDKTSDEVVVVLGAEKAKEELRMSSFRSIYKIEIYPLYKIIDILKYKTMDQNFSIKYSADVAILTLKKRLDLSPKINPICLPSVAESKETYVGKEAIVAGWGVTDYAGETSKKQMHVKVPIISNAQCQTFYDWIKRLEIENDFHSLLHLHFM